MGRTPQDVTDAELAVLHVLWDRGPATRRQITDVLYPGGGASPYTTVQKLLERLETKGHVRQERGPYGLLFSAVTDRHELISRRLRDVADKLCGGSLTPLLMNLVRAKPLTSRELQELHDLIQQAGQKRKPRSKPS
jgi:predicted transcriptional regulator